MDNSYLIFIALILFTVLCISISNILRKRGGKETDKDVFEFDGIIKLIDEPTITIRLPHEDIINPHKRRTEGLKALQKRKENFNKCMNAPERRSIFPFYIQKDCGCLAEFLLPDDFPSDDVVCIHGNRFIKFVEQTLENSTPNNIDDLIS